MLKKGYLYSESKEKHTIFIKEWQEDQNNFLKIQTDQVYYECQKYYTIEAFNQNFINSINWRMTYYQLETLLYGSSKNSKQISFERALHDFFKSFLIYQKTLIIEVDDDRDLEVLDNRPSQILLLNKKHVRSFQKIARQKLEIIKVNKARGEWHNLRAKIISQFLYRYRIQNQQSIQGKYEEQDEQDIYESKKSYLNNNEESQQPQSEESDFIYYFKFIIYEKTEEKYFLKCWDLSDYSSFEKQFTIKNLRQIFLSKLIDITHVIQNNITINIHNSSLEMSQFFNKQQEEMAGRQIIQYYFNNFFIEIHLQSIRSEFKKVLKRLKQQ